MKKFLLLILTTAFYILNLCAQSSDNYIRCIYLENYIKDSAKPKDIRQDEFSLDIYPDGKSAFYSVYERAIRISRDSLLRIGMTAAEVINQQADMPRTHQYFEYYKNIPEKGTYRCYDKVVKMYCYEEKLPSPQWNIIPETKELLGYTCQKANATIDGRTWEVWFTPQIPVGEGPWLLCGLPGMILEAIDTEGIFHFKAIELKNFTEELKEPSTNKIIRCTRKEFLNLRKNYEKDPTSGLKAITGRNLQIMGADGKPLKNKTKQINFFEK
ncbi:MAG: GLPGLI family protein [Phocaeicola sp.]|nr:GLPGLI family protein [Phocaeicola sp.]